jgi:hypothetical protein
MAGCTSPWAAKPSANPSSSEATKSLGVLPNLLTETIPSSDLIVPTKTIDPCTSENLFAEVKKINNPLLQFEQIVFIARYTPSAELIRPILELQNILFQSQIQEAPSCLATLKLHRDDYFSSVVSYLVHFMGGVKTEVLDTEMQSSLALRQAYENELALITGVNTPTPLPTSLPTLILTNEAPLPTSGTPQVTESPRPAPSTAVPAATTAVPSSTAIPSSTLTSTPIPSTTPSSTAKSQGNLETKTIPVTGGQGDDIFLFNDTGHNLFVHTAPSLTAQTVFILEIDQKIHIIGRTEDSIWLMAEYRPKTYGWIYSNTMAEFTIPIQNMPVVPPLP